MEKEELLEKVRNILRCGPKTSSEIHDIIVRKWSKCTPSKISYILKSNDIFEKTGKKGKRRGNTWKLKETTPKAKGASPASYSASKYE